MEVINTGQGWFWTAPTLTLACEQLMVHLQPLLSEQTSSFSKPGLQGQLHALWCQPTMYTTGS